MEILAEAKIIWQTTQFLTYMKSSDHIKQKKIDNYLGKGADINGVDEEGNNALMIMIQRSRWNHCYFLVNKKIKLKVTNYENDTALHMCVRGYAPQRLIQLIVRLGNCRDKKDARGKVPFEVAAEVESFDLLELLLPSNMKCQELIESINEGSSESIQYNMLEACLKKFAKRNFVDAFCENEWPDTCLELLYARDPEAYHTRVVDAAISRYKTRSEAAAKRFMSFVLESEVSNDSVSQLLTDAGPFSDFIKLAMDSNYEETKIRRLLDEGARPNMHSSHLIAAINLGYSPALIKDLIEMGCDVDYIEEDTTPMIAAITGGHDVITSHLLLARAKPPMIYASDEYALPFITLFCEHGYAHYIDIGDIHENDAILKNKYATILRNNGVYVE